MQSDNSLWPRNRCCCCLNLLLLLLLLQLLLLLIDKLLLLLCLTQFPNLITKKRRNLMWETSLGDVLEPWRAERSNRRTKSASCNSSNNTIKHSNNTRQQQQQDFWHSIRCRKSKRNKSAMPMPMLSLSVSAISAIQNLIFFFWPNRLANSQVVFCCVCP